MKKIIGLLLFTFLAIKLFSQTGKIRGTVIDEFGETVIGANVKVIGKTIGGVTDIDGKFSIDIPVGTHDVEVSFVTYQTIKIEGVVVKDGEVNIIGEINLVENNQELDVVVVTAKQVRNSEAAMIAIKKNSSGMLDGISASKMQQTGDATAVEAAKRVTGVSIEGGKYVYVRGLGDRYSKTMLNNVDIPGLDPDKNTLQMDIFPTNLLDNMMVSKNFTADMPADFTGGLMNIETKDFPEEKFFNFSVGTSFNPNMHFNNEYLTYDGGKTDFLGFDDGTRALPIRANSQSVPTPVSGASQEEVTSFVQSFSPELAAQRQMSLMDLSAGFSMGNQINLGEKDGKQRSIGYIFSLSYKTDYKYYDDVVYGEYQRFIDQEVYDLRYATIQSGQLGERNTLIGSLAGVAYKTGNSKIRLTAMRLQNSESRAGKFIIDNDGAAVGQSGYIASSDNLEYNQREMTNVLLNGKHVYDETGWELDWRLSPTLSKSNDPDIRKTAFTETLGDTLFNAGAGGNPSRIWRYLNEISATSRIDATKKYKFKEKDAKFKFGAMHTYKNRDYEIKFFDMQFFGNQNWDNPNPETVLNPENIYPNSPNSIYYQSGNNNPNPNAYQSNSNTSGVYFSNEMNILKNLKSVLGLRTEYFVLRHTGRDQAWASGNTEAGNNLVNEKVLESIDLFPSANFIYSATEKQNIRLGYSRTIARPSFKEMSYAQIIDPLTNRIFNGAFFEYNGWDGNLTETRIDNLDLRWEMFMDRSQLISASVFFKNFDDPIELVRIPEQQTSTEFQPRNVGDGKLFGVEMELRKNFGFITEKLEDFSFSTNVTLVKSQIDMTDLEFNSRKTYEKLGETIGQTRQMAGQSPYVINAGLTYGNYDNGWDAGLFYNVKGPTLHIVGAGLFPDVYTEPFHSLNFSLSKKLGKDSKTTIDFKVANILNDRIETFYQSFQAEKQPFSSINPGRAFSIGVSHNF